MKISDIMTTTVITIHRETLIGDVASIFVDNNIGGTPVIDDDGEIVGFVSKSDIVRFNATGEDPTYVAVHEIAHPKVISIEVSATIDEAASKILDEHVHHLIVMDGKDMLGVLSSLDFVEIVAQNPHLLP